MVRAKPHVYFECRVDAFIVFSDHFAAFFICKNSFEESYQRALAVLSRTSEISSDHYSIVKQHFAEIDVNDDDLTGIVTCD